MLYEPLTSVEVGKNSVTASFSFFPSFLSVRNSVNFLTFFSVFILQAILRCSHCAGVGSTGLTSTIHACCYIFKRKSSVPYAIRNYSIRYLIIYLSIYLSIRLSINHSNFTIAIMIIIS